MKTPKIGVLVFSAIAATVLLLLVAVPDRPKFDPRTGESLGKPQELLDLLRDQGDANLVLGGLPALRQRWPTDPALIAAERLLAAELTAPRVPDDDGAVAATTEAFFAPVAGADGGLDARAAHLLLRMDEQPPLREFLELAVAYRSAGRPRAQLRWLQRARGVHGDSPRLAIALARALIAAGDLESALSALSAPSEQTGGDPELFKLQAELASWLRRPAVEVAALESCVAVGNAGEARRRLVDLYDYLGQPERGVPHAVALARRAGGVADREKAAELALFAGVPDVAFDLLHELVDEGHPELLERIADLALQDLRPELAIRSLERLHCERPDPRVESRLYELYLRHDLPEKRAEILVARFERDPNQFLLGFEAMGLLVGLGQRERARRLSNKVRDSQSAPAKFFGDLSRLAGEGVPGLGALALMMTRAPALRVLDLPEVVSNLRPLAGQPRFQPVVAALLERFASSPIDPGPRLEHIGRLETTGARVAALDTLIQDAPVLVGGIVRWIDANLWPEDSAKRSLLQRTLVARAAETRQCRAALGVLLEDSGQPRAALRHLRYIADLEFGSQTDTARYVRSAVENGEGAAAIEWLLRRTRQSGASDLDRLVAADLLFETDRADLAREFYTAYLSADANHPRALLRIGRILTWANEPKGAVPFLRRRLESSDLNRTEVRFLLAEALWASAQRPAARKEYAVALAGFQLLPKPSVDVHEKIARSQFRLGRLEESEVSYRTLLDRVPDRVDLHLDFLDLLLNRGRLREAEVRLAIARRIDAENVRVMRAEITVHLRRRRYVAAEAALERYVGRHGEDASAFAELGVAQERSGAYPSALASYRRWFALRDDSVEAAISVQRATDRTANLAGVRVRSRRIGDDTAFESKLDGSVRLGERTRLFGAVGEGEYSGRAQVVAAGNQDVEADSLLGDIALSHRFRGEHAIGVGLMFHPDLVGQDAGAWAEFYLQDQDPYWSTSLRAYYGELLTNPIAAAGLEGRSTGAQWRGFVTLSERLWSGFELDHRRIGIRHPSTRQRLEDDYFTGHATLGYTWVSGRTAVTESFDPHRSVPGPLSPYLGRLAKEDSSWLVTSWVAYQAIRLRGDEDLLDLLPLGNRFDYAILASRVDHRMTTGFGCKFEAYVGTDLRGGGSVWGADLAATWRPALAGEATLSVGMGDELGRAGSGDRSAHLGVQVAWRF